MRNNLIQLGCLQLKMLVRVWRAHSHHTMLVGMKLVQPLRTSRRWFFKKLGVELPCDPAIPVLSRQGAKGNEIDIAIILPGLLQH